MNRPLPARLTVGDVKLPGPTILWIILVNVVCMATTFWFLERQIAVNTTAINGNKRDIKQHMNVDDALNTLTLRVDLLSAQCEESRKQCIDNLTSCQAKNNK